MNQVFFLFRDENEEKRAALVKAVIPEVKRKKESSLRRDTQNNAMTKKQLLKIQPEDKIVFNPPFTRFKFNCIRKLIKCATRLVSPHQISRSAIRLRMM